MTNFRIEQLTLDAGELTAWADSDGKHRNWPVVYTLNGEGEIYIGESVNAVGRLRQHLDSPLKRQLSLVRVVVDDQFNKSACLDLESHLIRLVAGDGKYRLINRNVGITDADYYRRDQYRRAFADVFEELKALGVLSRPVKEIEASDLFKLSPFKALTSDQAIAVEDILDGLFTDLAMGVRSRMLIKGEPGTGKTVVAIYLMKLLSDIRSGEALDEPDEDVVLSKFFTRSYTDMVDGFRIGLVVPQQSLRESIRGVFTKTPGLDKSMVLSPFEVGLAEGHFDLLIVDEAHRLNQRANQSSGVNNRRFADINRRLFDEDQASWTQIDWINAMSDSQIFLVDEAQSVRPADVSKESLARLANSIPEWRRYTLTSQMRVHAGDDYVGYVRRLISPDPPAPRSFDGYEFWMFDNLGDMIEALRDRDNEYGLGRALAGYAWPWKSKKEKAAFDIELDGQRLRWNSSERDWVNSPRAKDEVGSIHTIQGYDLNYAGVIIGKDLRYDPRAGQIYFDRASYFDTKGKENNQSRGITYTDADLLKFVENIYAVLMTRGMRGTFVYACDPALREYLRSFVPPAPATRGAPRSNQPQLPA
jgi:hypothetical protein